MPDPILKKEDFLECANLDDLSKKYKEKGIEFKDTEGLYEKAKKDWFLTYIGLKDLDDLPGTKVVDRGISFYVHGVIHGFRGFKEPSESVKKYIDSKIKDLEVLLYEEGFKEIFDLKKGINMRDGKIVPISEYKFVISSPFYFPSEENPLKEGREKLLLRSLEDENCFKKARLIFIGDNIPGRFKLDYLKRKTILNRANIRSITEMRLDRSKYMAEYMRTYARQKKYREIHSLVGLNHENDIAYFIKNEKETREMRRLVMEDLAYP
ncbi:MAG: hypothetical protein ACE5K4_01995 [Candidatus Hydrothermarchaeota archaeon]